MIPGHNRLILMTAGFLTLTLLMIPWHRGDAYRRFDEPAHVKKERCQTKCGDRQRECISRAEKKKKWERKKVLGICRNFYIKCLDNCEKAYQDQ